MRCFEGMLGRSHDGVKGCMVQHLGYCLNNVSECQLAAPRTVAVLVAARAFGDSKAGDR